MEHENIDERVPTIIEAHLIDGTAVCLRPIHRSDEALIEKGIAELSDRSRYLRFFSGFKTVPPSVLHKLAEVDHMRHLAWAIVDTSHDQQRAFGAAHAMRDSPECVAADFSIAVLDDYHGLGAAQLIMAALFSECAVEGIEELRMDVLRENKRAIALLRNLGASVSATEGFTVQYRLNVEQTLGALRNGKAKESVAATIGAFGR